MGRVFVGRERELEALSRLFDDASNGQGGVVLIVGEPGIGKTRLAEELAAYAAGRGARVAWGRAWEGGGTPALWPWRQAVRAWVGISGVASDAVPAALAGLARATGGRGDVGPSAGARFALYESVVETIRLVTSDAPAVLVLDDMHIADVASLELLHFVVRERRRCRLFVVVTSRELSFHSTTEVSNLLAKIARESLLIPLARLQRDQVGRWIEQAAPSLVTELDALLATSEGNPLFVCELLVTAALRASSVGVGPLPLGIRGAVQEHLALLTPEARALLETASVLGREISRSALGPLIAPSALDSLAFLDEALSKGVVVDVGDGILRFSHVLLRDELHAQMPSARRAMLHRAAWRQAADPATALYHALEGARPEDTEELARTALAAVHEACGRLAFGDAAAAGERTLARLTPDDVPALASDLHRATAEALMFAGRRDEATRHYTLAADLAARVGDVERLVGAALGAAYEPSMSPRPDVTRLLRRAARALPDEDSPLAAAVLGRLARAILPPQAHELAEYLDLRERSLAMARRLGTSEVLLDVLSVATEGFQELFPIDQQHALNAEAIALAEELGRVAGVVPLLPWQVALCLQRGDMGAAKREVVRAEAILSKFRERHYRWRAPLIRALPTILEGRFAEGDELQRRALDEAHATDERIGVLAFSIQRLVLHYQRGDSDGMAEFDDLSARAQSNLPLGELFLSLGYAIAGRVDDARACLAHLDRQAAAGVPGVSTLGWACVEARLAELAPLYIEFVEADLRTGPFVFGPFGLVTLGPTQLLYGRLLLLVDRREEAEVALREARALAEKLGARPTLVHADVALAELERRRASPRANDLAISARDQARDLGMPRVAERAEAILGGASGTSRVAGSARKASPATAGVVQPGAPRSLTLERHGPAWTVTAGATRLVVKDVRGLAYLAELLRRPHREIHVLELAGQGEVGDAGPLLDDHAKAAYRERVESLRDELAEATKHHDLGRADRLRAELEALTDELTRAVGLHGRVRLAGSRAERARSSVQRRLRDAVRRVAEQDAALGRHLELSVKTGTFCTYAPTWPAEDE